MFGIDYETPIDEIDLIRANKPRYGSKKSDKWEIRARKYAGEHVRPFCFDTEEEWVNYLTSAFQSGDLINPCADCVYDKCIKET